MTDVPTHEDFRKIGFTGAAAEFPLSLGALAFRAETLNISLEYLIEKLPPAYRYSPNALMRAWYEALGDAKLRGLVYQDADGRYWTPARLKEAYNL